MKDAPTPAFPDAQKHWDQRFERDGFVFGTAPNGWLTNAA